MSERNCPNCEKPMIRIVYGYPSPETQAMARRGEIRLGGCIIRQPLKTHECRECGACIEVDTTAHIGGKKNPKIRC